MAHYLLTGAGFSYNWGGWLASEAFEYLLGAPERMRSNVNLRIRRRMKSVTPIPMPPNSGRSACG
jgi:hypothetical protein